MKDKHFETITAAKYGDYQILFEQGIHVNAYRATIWNVTKDPGNKNDILDYSLLDLCDRVVIGLRKLPVKKEEISWLD